MTTNEKLMKTILDMVDNFADPEDEVGMTLLTLATNLLQPEVKEKLQKKWHIIQEEGLEERDDILPLLFGNMIDYYSDNY